MGGSVFRRCTTKGCRRRLAPRIRRCPACGGEGFTWAFIADVGASASGDRRQRRHGGYRTKEDADRALRELLGQVDAGTNVDPSKLTVAEYLQRWLEGIRVKPTTLSNYRVSAEAYTIPRIGGVALQRLTAEHVDELYRELERSGRRDGGPLAPKTVRHVHTMLRKALQAAVDRGHVARNVADLANPPTQRQARSRAAKDNAWAPEQLRDFLTHDRVVVDRLYAAWYLLSTTGMRRAELLGLRATDVDLDAATARVGEQTLTVAGGQLVWGSGAEPAKTDAAVRTISLDDDTVGVLRAHRARQLEERMAAGPAWCEDDDHGPLLFRREDGRPINPERFTERFARLVKGSGLPRIDVHGLRHSYATAALRAGVSPEVVSERLGHADVAITLSIYAHVRPRDDRDAAALVAAHIFGKL